MPSALKPVKNVKKSITSPGQTILVVLQTKLLGLTVFPCGNIRGVDHGNRNTGEWPVEVHATGVLTTTTSTAENYVPGEGDLYIGQTGMRRWFEYGNSRFYYIPGCCCSFYYISRSYSLAFHSVFQGPV